MKTEIFKARLLQIQLEADALNATLVGMAAEDADRTRQGYALAWGQGMYNEVSDALRALQVDIKKLIDEHQSGKSSKVKSVKAGDIQPIPCSLCIPAKVFSAQGNGYNDNDKQCSGRCQAANEREETTNG